MNPYFIAAACLVLAIGLIHSVLGEILVFRRMRPAGLIPTNGAPILREPHVRILWATWHLVTVMGVCIAAILFWLALASTAPAARSVIAGILLTTMFVSSALVLVGTKGRHPGWAGLLAVAVLTAIGRYA